MKYLCLLRSFISFSLFLSIFLSSFGFLHSQKLLWQQGIGGKQGDYLYDMVSTPDYGFLLAGSSLSGITQPAFEDKNPSLDFFLWKMNQAGAMEWQKSFGGDKSDYLYSVNLTRDGGYILGGSSYSSAARDKKDSCRGQEDYWIIKLDASGQMQWQKTLGGSGSDRLLSIEQTLDGGYIVGGSSDSPLSSEKMEASRGSMDFWVIKLNNKGSVEWQKTLGGSGYDLLRRVKQTSDGYILAGFSNSSKGGDKSDDSSGQGDFWLVKLDHNGYKLWDKTIGGSLDDELIDMIITTDGNYLLVGSSNSPQGGMKSAVQGSGSDIWLVKTDRQGEILWQQGFDIGIVDTPNRITETEQGNILIAGSTVRINKNGEAESDYLVIKVTDKGEELWRKQLGGEKKDWLQGAVETRDGYLVLAGTSDSPKGRDKMVEARGQADFWVVKLADNGTKTEEVRSKVIEVYPNPTERFVNVIIHQPLKGTEKLEVYDLTGKLLQSNRIKYSTTPIDLGGYVPGVYVLKVSLPDGKVETIKVIKMYN